MYKLKLQIGEFSKLSNVSVKTLRHYEKMGLLRPFEVDESSGYRYYQVSQLQDMLTIRNLKEVGFSLEEIGELMDSDSQMPGPDLLLAKIRQTEAQLKQLVLRRNRLQSMVDSQQKYKDMEEITIQALPAITVASYRGVIASYDKLGDLCVNVIGPEMMRLGCECPEPGYCFTIEHQKEYKDLDLNLDLDGNVDIDIEYCEQVVEPKQDSDLIKFKQLPAVPAAVCIKCYGPYERLYQHYVDAFAYIAQKGYKIVGSPRANYVDGIWNQSDPEKWLTIVQIPVEQVQETKLNATNRLKLYCCPKCGEVAVTYGHASLTCCSSPLQPIPIKKAEQHEKPTISEVDGDQLLEFNNPMTKDFYIAAVVFERYDRVEVVRLFPEQEASVRVPMLAGAKVFVVYRQQDSVWGVRL